MRVVAASWRINASRRGSSAGRLASRSRNLLASLLVIANLSVCEGTAGTLASRVSREVSAALDNSAGVTSGAAGAAHKPKPVTKNALASHGVFMR